MIKLFPFMMSLTASDNPEHYSMEMHINCDHIVAIKSVRTATDRVVSLVTISTGNGYYVNSPPRLLCEALQRSELVQ